MAFAVNLSLALPALPSFTMDIPELPPTLALALLILDALLLAGLFGYLPQLRYAHSRVRRLFAGIFR